ncbi:obsolete signal transducer activity [Sparganum proliferum]
MICHPFIAKRFCTIALSKLIIVCILFVSLFYTIPRFLEYKFVDITVLSPLSTGGGLGIGASVVTGGEQTNISWYVLSALGQSKSFRNGYHLWSWCILVIGIPSVIIAVLNVFLVREINSSIRRMRFEHGVKTRQQETDVMLIGVIVIFFVCQIPSSVSHVLWGTQKQSANTSISWLVVNEVGNLLIILNASINIIPYYMFSRKFRVIFMRIYFWWALGFINKRRKPKVTTITLQRCRSLQTEAGQSKNGRVPLMETKSDGFFSEKL